MKKLQPATRALYIIIGLAFIIWAILPTPDDVTIVSPVACLTTGVTFLVKGAEDHSL